MLSTVHCIESYWFLDRVDRMVLGGGKKVQLVGNYTYCHLHVRGWTGSYWLVSDRKESFRTTGRRSTWGQEERSCLKSCILPLCVWSNWSKTRGEDRRAAFVFAAWGTSPSYVISKKSCCV